MLPHTAHVSHYDGTSSERTHMYRIFLVMGKGRGLRGVEWGGGAWGGRPSVDNICTPERVCERACVCSHVRRVNQAEMIHLMLIPSVGTNPAVQTTEQFIKRRAWNTHTRANAGTHAARATLRKKTRENEIIYRCGERLCIWRESLTNLYACMQIRGYDTG